MHCYIIINVLGILISYINATCAFMGVTYINDMWINEYDAYINECVRGKFMEKNELFFFIILFYFKKDVT